VGAEEIQARDRRLWRFPEAQVRGAAEAHSEGRAQIQVQDLQEGASEDVFQIEDF